MLLLLVKRNETVEDVGTIPVTLTRFQLPSPVFEPVGKVPQFTVLQVVPPSPLTSTTNELPLSAVVDLHTAKFKANGESVAVLMPLIRKKVLLLAGRYTWALPDAS